MKENFQAISEALSASGFNTPPKDASGQTLDFKLTPYSLNTKLSFRFESVDEFIEFLQLSDNSLSEEEINAIHAVFIELGLNPKEFFYVNFFERNKEEEQM